MTTPKIRPGTKAYEERLAMLRKLLADADARYPR